MWKLTLPRRLRVGARPVEVGRVPVAPDRQLQLERVGAAPVIVDPVPERHLLLGDVLTDQADHPLLRPLEQRVAGVHVELAPEALAEVDRR